MLSKKFMNKYISFLAMAMTILIIGSTYFYGTLFLARFVSEDYQQAIAITFGIFALFAGYKMMDVIEQNKEAIIAEIEESVHTRFY